MKKFLLPAIVLLLFSISVSAQSFPKPVNYASDFANVIEPEWEAAINSLGREIELNSTSQVFIAAVDDTTPYVAKEYATKLFDEWNIGQKGKDNGVLILLTFKPERRVEIETGYGVEGILTDSRAGNIRREFTPLLTEGKYGEGLFKMAKATGDVISGSGEFSGTNKSEDYFDNFWLVIWLVVFVFIILSFVLGRVSQKCPDCKIKMAVAKTTEDGEYTVYEFVCKKCGKKIKKKVRRRHGIGGMIIVAGGGFGGGSGGGF